ncbi:MAG: HEAT repeat domain-containing protein [Deltaproteobacteria bacterium]|nr:HEAT repeat domain-containing protein [Deltaproteobacteria bacterium]
MGNERPRFVMVVFLVLGVVTGGSASAQEGAEGPREGTAEGVSSEPVAAVLTFEEALHQLYAPRPEDRQAALRRLSELADPASVPNIVQVLRQDPDENVRRFAVIALGNIGGAAALEDLQRAAAGDPAAAVRQTAAEVVRRLGGTPPAPTEPVVPVVPVAPVPVVPSPVATLTPRPSGGIAVLESQGIDGAAGGQTEVDFTSGEAGLQVSRVTARATARDAWSGQSLNVEAVASEPVCRTPCRILLPNGYHTFLAGDYEFSLDARGGSQAWALEDESAGMRWGGIMLTGFGGGFLVGGLACIPLLGDGGSIDTMVYAFIGGGALLTAIGIPLWALSSGSAEMLPQAAPRVAANSDSGLYLVPGLAGIDPATGRSAWGLNLRLVL